MLVTDIRLDEEKGAAVLSAPVYLDGSNLPFFNIRYVFHELPAAAISTGGDAFLAALLLPAMTMGEDLTIEVPVSPQLMANLPTIGDIYKAWWPRLRRVKVLAPAESEAPASRERGIGLFFSGGVDSWYSLLKNLEMHPVGDDAVTELVFVAGMDTRFGYDARYLRNVGGLIQEVAEATGKRALILESNLRELGKLWHKHHGAGLASVGLALSPAFKRLMIASSHAYRELVPWGSHLILDPLWSTEVFDVRHDGCEYNRLGKISSRLAFSDTALSKLRVCGQRDQQPLNCGKCPKCIRTMLILYAVGVLDRCPVFLAPLDPRTVPRMTSDDIEHLMESLLARLGDSEFDRKIARALRRKWWRSDVGALPQTILLPRYTRRGRFARAVYSRVRR